MAQNPPPPVDDGDDIYAAMKKLMQDSQIVRSAHFIAAERKDPKAKIFGVLVILFNLLITSGLIEIAFKGRPDWIAAAVKLLSFMAAAFAALQTFLNYQKEIECHRKSGGVYSSIYHRTRLVMAEYQEQPANRPDLIGKFKALSDEYLKANDDATVCVPTDSDYDKARGRGNKMAARDAAPA